MSEVVVTDTAFLIDLLVEDEGAVHKLEAMIEIGEPLWIPSIALHELYYGAHLHAEEEREVDRIREMEQALPPVGFPAEAASIAGQVEAAMAEEGEHPGRADVQIAATAIARGEAVVTRDERFAKIEGLRVEAY